MASTPPPEQTGWINPRRTFAATKSGDGETAGGGGHSRRPLKRPGSPVVEEIMGKLRKRRCPTSITDFSSGADHARYGAIRVRCPPSAMTDRSGGLADGGLDTEHFCLCKYVPETSPNSNGSPPHPNHPCKNVPDPYWKCGGFQGWGSEEEWRDEYAEAVEEERSGETQVVAEESKVDESESQCSPNFFPWQMEGETWEAAMNEAERQMKEEDLTWLQTDDDGPKRL